MERTPPNEKEVAKPEEVKSQTDKSLQLLQNQLREQELTLLIFEGGLQPRKASTTPQRTRGESSNVFRTLCLIFVTLSASEYLKHPTFSQFGRLGHI